MYFDFEDPTLGVTCNSKQKLTSIFGPHASLVICRLLYALKAAPTLADLSQRPPISRRISSNDAGNCFAIGPIDEVMISFVAANQDVTTLNQIKKITIINIGGSYDK